MKNIKSLLYAFGVVALLGACSNDNSDISKIESNKSVTFTSNIKETRAIGTEWSKNDAIGIYALKADGFDIFESKANIEYATAMGDGIFTVKNSAEALELGGKEALDIIAYYPFKNDAGSFAYAIDVTDQSDSEKIDLLYSNNVKGLIDETQPTLNFSHKLSQFQLQLTAGKGVASLDNLAVTSLDGTKLKAGFDLKKGVISFEESEKGTSLIPKLSKSEALVKVDAILIPGNKIDDIKIVMELDGKKFAWKGTKNLTLESGKRYIFKGELQIDGEGKVVILNPDSSIQDWEVGHEDEDIDPNLPEDGFGINITSLDLGASASVNKVNITAGDDQDWTITTEANWVTVTPLTGKGDSEITVSVAANDAETNRTAEVKFTSGESVLLLAIAQKAKEASGGAELVELFKDDFNTVTSNKGTNKVTLANYTKTMQNTQINHPEIMYGGTTDIRASANTDGNMWFAGHNKYDEDAIITNIVIGSAKDLVLSVDLTGQHAEKINANVFEISVCGVPLDPLPDSVLAGGIDYETFTLSVPNSAIKDAEGRIFIEFHINGDNFDNCGIRLDNVILKGVK